MFISTLRCRLPEGGQHIFDQAPVRPAFLLWAESIAPLDQEHPFEPECGQFAQLGHAVLRCAHDAEPVEEAVIQMLDVERLLPRPA